MRVWGVPVVAVSLCLLAAPAGSAAPVASTPTARWDVYATATYSDTTKVTDDHCFPTAEQIKPSTVEAEASRKLTMKTTVPGTVVMHEAPNGVAAVAEDSTGTTMRVSVSEERSGDLDAAGVPIGCVAGAPAPKPDCGTRSIATGTYLGALGKIHHWEGFTVEPQEVPRPFERCGISTAQQQMPEPLALDVIASPKQLLSHRSKLVLRRRIPVPLSGKHEGAASTATGTLTYKVELRRP